VSFSETPDGRLLIVLTGTCRFDLEQEIPTTRGYRRATVLWDRFKEDYTEKVPSRVARTELLATLRSYLTVKKLETDWEAIERLDDPMLCNVLTGVLPLSVAERQALVEAVTLDERESRLVSLLAFEIAESAGASVKRH
jgi:hypothetical protein